MTLAQPVQPLSPEQYYRLERAAQTKSDYYRGEVFAMGGGTIRHSLICMNLGAGLHTRLAASPCTAYESNLRLKIKATGLRTYPDVSVYCDPPEPDEEDASGETLTNPTVLFEVLSKSTEAYDRGFKARNYRQIASLRGYLLIAQEEPRVEAYQRQGDGPWVLSEADGMESVVMIESIRITMPLAEIYARVDFGERGTT